jgi:hypothetical protein
VTGAKVPLVAVRVFAPSPAPRVQLPTVAMPAELVVAAPPVIDPPPTVTANVTGTPAIGNPFRSFTMTDGRSAAATCAPGGAMTVVKEFGAIDPAPWTGPDASPPQETCNANRPTESSGETTDRSFMIGISARCRLRQYRRKAKATKMTVGDY